MSTTRLFDQDAYLGEFEATVERSVCEGGMYRVLLDQTAFFPEGGGQPADEGTLDGIFVTDVQEIDGEIWHTVEAPLEPGKTVVGKLDFEKRFSNMQNHCGEHIVSGIVHRIYDAHEYDRSFYSGRFYYREKSWERQYGDYHERGK